MVKIGQWVPVLQKSSSDWKATATNRMHSNDLEACGEKCCYFWCPSEVLFLTSFFVALDLVIFTYFLSNSSISNGVKCLIYIYLGIIFMKKKSARFANKTPVSGTRPLGL